MSEHDQVLKELQELTEWDDPEYAHSRADELLIGFLRTLGYDELVDTWLKVEKWYA